MEIVTGVLPSVIRKLGELLVGEYNLQKEVKGGIIFLQEELESIQGALEKISNTPADQLDEQDRIWARAVRELSYDIEDKVDTFLVQCKGSRQAKHHGFKKVVDRSLDLLMQPRIRRRIAMDIRDIKSRVEEVGKRRDRYKVNYGNVPKAVTVDPRLFARYQKLVDLIGIDEARDEVIKILGEDNEVSKKQDKIVSIVGSGGLGKTTLANAVYEKLRATFDCSAFVSVSQTPDMDKLFKEMLKQISKETNPSINVIDDLRELLEKKRYLVVVDDIWDITTWKMIKCALPDNNVGCKIITTTRILSIAEHAGDAYKQKSLSLQNSRKLLYRRIFGNKNGDANKDPETCPDKEFAEVSDKIIKKCAGVPLAIITIASLLANKGRNKMEWYDVYNSIGTGMENSLDTENMRKILSYSYYDMPWHLRTCLLYLSIFPEDYEIEKDRLIWLWIGEGFIQPREQGQSLFNHGESYFNELISRSMIQPVHDELSVEIQSCRVHDMVLDLIRSISSEENFITILSNMDHKSSSTMVRRLSLQNGKADHVITQATRSMPQVRSVVVFRSDGLDQMPALPSFKVLRVLDLRGCDLSQGDNGLKHLGSLLHLRYLGLRRTILDQLPDQVGNLQFLKILDISFSSISYLSLTVAQLTDLLCLSVDWRTRVFNGIGSLTSLEELSWLRIDDESTMDTIKGLGVLTELRVLRIHLETDKWDGKLVESLCKLRKIQDLLIRTTRSMCKTSVLMNAWVAPRQLRRLDTSGWFSVLPAWMNNLRDLSSLDISVRELRQEDLEILGRLPTLRNLTLQLDHEDLGIVGRFVFGAGSFPCLTYHSLLGFVGPVVFQQGAMPRLTTLIFYFHVRAAREITASDGGFDLGLANLPSLQHVMIAFQSKGTSEEEVEEAKAAVRKEAETHPNRPIFEEY